MTNTFTYMSTLADWGRIAPELVLIAITIIVMMVDLVLPHQGKRSKHSGPSNYVILPLLSLLGLAGAALASALLMGFGDGQRAFNDMVGSDNGTLVVFLVILTASALGVLLSPAYLKRLELVHQGEYYALILLATTGMLLMAAATSFIVVFLGLEMLSLALYILCSFVTKRKASQESGMKYFLLSSFASAFLLYGIALIYGSTGSTTFHCVAQFFSGPVAASNCPPISAPGHSTAMLLIGMGLLAVGFAFKVSAIPFQAWTPDVYEGAPAPVTAFMSVGTKAAALIAFARVFAMVLPSQQSSWMPIIWAITVLTIVGGNVLAIAQTNVKRLLAYSSIAHAGYLLIGIIVAGTPGASNGSTGIAAIIYYLACYAFLNLGAFGVLSLLERVDNSGTDLKDLKGLFARKPALAALLAFFLISLAGIPPMAGFSAKFYMFYAALAGGHPELLIIAVLASILGIYYYLRVVATMFMEREGTQVQESVPAIIPATPIPTAARRVAAKVATGTLSGGGAAVAVRTPTTSLPKAPTAVLTRPAEGPQATRLIWMSYVALGAAVIGTFFMGTVFPIWLGNLQQAAQAMLNSIK